RVGRTQPARARCRRARAPRPDRCSPAVARRALRARHRPVPFALRSRPLTAGEPTMLIRPLLPSIASLALCLGGAIAQSDRTPAQRSPDLQRFERIAEELKRAGDNDLAERLMQAARKISAQARSGRAAGRAAPEDREPRAAAGERPGRDTVRAQGVPGRTDAVTTPRGEGRGQARQPAAAAPG